jgi:hypothetical protein
MADLCVARMKDAQKPMPPSGALAAAQIAILEGWIAGGMPKGTCGTVSATSGASVCTSNTQWTRGNHESPSMHPGVACIACHSSGEGPRFAIAGTVYPTAHEPDDCNGVSGGIAVVITDANGTSHSLSVNGAGNFYSSTRIPTPYTASVTANGKTRTMTASQTNGDCNSCHTEHGAQSAPGRIMAP